MRFSSTAPSASENPMVILTRLSLERSGTIEIDVAVGGDLSIVTTRFPDTVEVTPPEL
jgi:hypothetical protein